MAGSLPFEKEYAIAQALEQTFSKGEPLSVSHATSIIREKVRFHVSTETVRRIAKHLNFRLRGARGNVGGEVWKKRVDERLSDLERLISQIVTAMEAVPKRAEP